MQTDITRPIIGIENRTAQEVFDVMCDRIRSRLSASLPADAAELVTKLQAPALGLSHTTRQKAASLIQSQAARIAELETFRTDFEKPGEFPLDDEELDTIAACIRNEQHNRIMALELMELVRVYRAARALLNRRAEG